MTEEDLEKIAHAISHEIINYANTKGPTYTITANGRGYNGPNPVRLAIAASKAISK